MPSHPLIAGLDMRPVLASSSPAEAGGVGMQLPGGLEPARSRASQGVAVDSVGPGALSHGIEGVGAVRGADCTGLPGHRPPGPRLPSVAEASLRAWAAEVTVSLLPPCLPAPLQTRSVPVMVTLSSGRDSRTLRTSQSSVHMATPSSSKPSVCTGTELHSDLVARGVVEGDATQVRAIGTQEVSPTPPWYRAGNWEGSRRELRVGKAGEERGEGEQGTERAGDGGQQEDTEGRAR